MRNLKKSLLPLLLAVAMLLMSVSVSAASLSPSVVKNATVTTSSVVAGKTATPKVTVTVAGKVVDEKNYDVTVVSGDLNTAGTVTVKVKGKGEYAALEKEATITVTKQTPKTNANKNAEKTLSVKGKKGYKKSFKVHFAYWVNGVKYESTNVKLSVAKKYKKYIKINGNKITAKRAKKNIPVKVTFKGATPAGVSNTVTIKVSVVK